MVKKGGGQESRTHSPTNKLPQIINVESDRSDVYVLATVLLSRNMHGRLSQSFPREIIL